MKIDPELLPALQTFVVESREQLETMEQELLMLEAGEASDDALHAIFRAAHTIKGSSGLFGLEHIVAFTHVVESVLDEMREGRLDTSPAVVAALLPCCDHIQRLIDAVAREHYDPEPAVEADGEVLLATLRPLLGRPAPAAADATVTPMGARAPASGDWHLSLRFGADSLRNGMDPIAFVNYLRTVGELVRVVTLADGMPAAAEMDAETCYLGFEIDLRTQADKAAIERVFEFVREDSFISILPADSRLDDWIALIRSLPEEDMRIGEILVKAGLLTARELESGLEAQAGGSQPLGEILVEGGSVPQQAVDAALTQQKQGRDKRQREAGSLRVDAARLDRLIDLVGELVIAGAGVNLRASRVGDAGLNESTAEVMRLVQEVRDSALQLRMVPIGSTFSRFQRIVRDVAGELGKDIELVITGGETEVDKSVVEKIGDPLVHLVRNAIDHGIEKAEVRVARGKPARGTLRLDARHESGSIVIEVSDDGGGLDRDRILAKAVERGLVAADAQLSDQDIYALIFEPGFSTAAAVSNLSGRGVGMDVVKRNVQELRGTVEVESRQGEGATMRVRLPLTLAIIDGFLVSVAQSSFVVPLERVVECLELDAAMAEHGNYMNLRGEVLPFLRLRQVFEIEAAPPRRENVVVVEHAGARAGLVVDALLGEFQTVIKPLGRLFEHVRGIGGSTILSTGDVALILDVGSLIGAAIAGASAGVAAPGGAPSPQRVTQLS